MITYAMASPFGKYSRGRPIFPSPRDLQQNKPKQYCKLHNKLALQQHAAHSAIGLTCLYSIFHLRALQTTMLFDLTFDPFYCQVSYPLTVNTRNLPQ